MMDHLSLQLLLTPTISPMSSYHYLNNSNTVIVIVIYLFKVFVLLPVPSLWNSAKLGALDLLSPTESWHESKCNEKTNQWMSAAFH